MERIKVNKPTYYLRVSALAQIEFCPIRSKLLCFTNLAKFSTNINKAIITGIKLHKQYSYANRSFDRVRCRTLLGKDVFSKQLILKNYNIIVRGLYDDLNIITYNTRKYCSLIELKTTNKKYLWSRETKAAIRQLQLYMWLLKDKLEAIGYPLWKRSYLLIYSQSNGELIRRIPVQYNEFIEEWIEQAIEQFIGVRKISLPSYSYCKLCPTTIKERCSYYILRKK